jgi:hypothetical protein
MVKVKVANPGPAALMVVNGRRRKTMATKRRKSTRRKARRTTALVSNPRPRRRRSYSMRRRTHNPPFIRRRRRSSGRRRHRNPSSGLLTQGLILAAGAALVQFILGFVPPIGGVSPIADAARTAGVGFGLGTLMDKTGIGRKYGRDVMLAGFTLAGGKVITSFILPFATSIFRPTPPPANGSTAGMGAIGVMPEIPMGMGMGLPATAPSGVQGMGVWPGVGR